MKASDFEVGERVHDTDILDNGTVVSVGAATVTVDFDGGDVAFTFDEGDDLRYLAKGEAA